MKKCRLLSFGFILFLTGCGVNTLNWPTINFSFSSNEITSIAMNFVSKEKGYFSDEIVIVESEKISGIFETIDGIPIKEEKENSIETNNYLIRLSIDFHLNDAKSTLYRLVYYEYGIADGKIMFDNGDVHWLPGNLSLLYYDSVNL